MSIPCKISLAFGTLLLLLVGCGGQLEPTVNTPSQVSSLAPAAFTSTLVAQHSQKCAELPAESTTPGKQLIQWNCNPGEAKQQFSFHPVAQADTYLLQNVNSKLCVSVSPKQTYGGHPTVEQLACSEASSYQQFTLRAAPDTEQTFQLVAKHSDKCLDVYKGSEKNRTLLIEYRCHTDANQQWRVEGYPKSSTPTHPTTPPTTPPTSPDIFTASLVADHSGKCADVTRASTQPGTPLVQWSCHGEVQQRFTFTPIADKAETYTVTNVNSELCLEIEGDKVTQEVCRDRANQRVVLEPAGAELFRLESAGACLDVASGSSDNRAALVGNTCSQAQSQRWRVERGAGTPPTPPTAPTSGNDVVPVAWASFTQGKPSDANAVRLEQIVNNANRYMLTTWWDEKNYNQPGSYLDFGGRDEHFIRHPGAAAVGLAVALETGIYNANATGVPTVTAKAKTLKLVRSLAHHHKANKEGGWGYSWQSALWAHKTGFAAWLLWDDLSAKDRQNVQNMLVGEADRLLEKRVPYYRDANGTVRKPGDTKAEENAWNASVLHLASVMMPNHERGSEWRTKNVEYKLSAYATPSDLSSVENFHGRPLKTWLNGSNAYNDAVVLNHGRVHPDYMAAIEHHLEGALASSLARQATPRAALIHVDTTYEALVERDFPAGYVYPDTTRPARAPGGTMYVPGSGDLYYPQGNDWGTDRVVPYVLLDALVGSFELDGRVTKKADYWEALHAQKLLEQQSRHADGRTYATAREDKYKGREAYVNEFAALAYLSKWVTHQGAFSVSNESYSGTR